MQVRRNKNRGYQKLRVWNEAIDYYKRTCDVFKNFPFDLKRIASQQIASCDSVHRNISEGYCRHSIREYLNFLNIALSSLGESVSGINACRQAKQISENEYNSLDSQAYKLENGLLRLIESLEKKKESGEWIDHLFVKENNRGCLFNCLTTLKNSLSHISFKSSRFCAVHTIGLTELAAMA